MPRRTRPRLTPTALLTLLLALVLAPAASAQVSERVYAERGTGVHVLDDARVISEDDESSVQEELVGLLEETGIDIAVYTQKKERVGTRRDAQAEAAALLAEWGVGGDSGLGAVMFWNINEDGSVTRNGVALGEGFAALDAQAIDENVNEVIRSATRDGDWESALRVGVLNMQSLLVGTEPLPVPSPSPSPSPPPGATLPPLRPTTTQGERPTSGLRPGPGPDFPDSIPGERIYDYAEVVSPDVIDRLGATIDAIEERTGAQVVIYTQVKPEGNDPGTTERDAAALIDQWGIGRAGFDDGMVIFFNLLDDRCHGQVQLYAAPGFAASYLTNGERQAIYEQTMLPALRRCDFDAALLPALERIDEAANAERARDLRLARQVDAVAGLIVAPLLLVGLVAWAGWSWLRYGRDPVYLDDASILMPAPPPGMTGAAAAAVIDGRARRHALTTALVDLAARGEISFRASESDPQQISIDITVPDQRDARLARNRREPLGPAEQYALAELRKLGGAIRTIDSDDVRGFAKAVPGFEDRLDDHVAARGWFRESPGDATDRWTRRGAAVLIAGVAGVFLGFQLPSSGLLLVGAAAVAGAVAILVISRTMPSGPWRAPACSPSWRRIGARSRRHSSSRARWTRSWPVMPCRGSRRPTRRCSGPTPSVCTKRPRRSWSDPWRMCVRARHRPPGPTSRSGMPSVSARVRASAEARARPRSGCSRAASSRTSRP